MKGFPQNVQLTIIGNEHTMFVKPGEDLSGEIWLMEMMCPERSNPAAGLLKIIKDMPEGTELFVSFRRY